MVLDIDFTRFSDTEVVIIVHCLTEQMNREKHKFMKDDITTMLEIFNGELARRINKYSEKLEMLKKKIIWRNKS